MKYIRRGSELEEKSDAWSITLRTLHNEIPMHMHSFYETVAPCIDYLLQLQSQHHLMPFDNHLRSQPANGLSNSLMQIKNLASLQCVANE